MADLDLTCPRCQGRFTFHYRTDEEGHDVAGIAFCPSGACREPVRVAFPWNAFDRWTEPSHCERRSRFDPVLFDGRPGRRA